MYKAQEKIKKVGETLLNAAQGLLKKDRGDKQFIVEVGFIVVAVTLLLVFRTQVSGVISTIITAVQTEINSLF